MSLAHNPAVLRILAQELGAGLAPLSWDALIGEYRASLARIWDAFCPDDGRPQALLTAMLAYRGDPTPQNYAALAQRAAAALNSQTMAERAGKQTDTSTKAALTAQAAYYIISGLLWAIGGIAPHVPDIDREEARAHAQDGLYTARLTAAIVGNTVDEDEWNDPHRPGAAQ